MSRSCTVCAHPEAFEINEALVLEKRSNRTIAHQFGLHYSAVQRHREHIPELLVEASRAQEVADADTLLEDIARIRASAFELLDEAESSEDWRARVAAIRECRENVRILGELYGRLQTQGTVNILMTPEYVEARTLIVQALEPFPAARDAVVRALGGGSNGIG